MLLPGYLCGQMQFPDSPRDSELPQKNVGDESEKPRPAWAILPAIVHLYTGQVPAMCIAGFFVSTKPTRPKSHDRYRNG